MGYLPEDTKPSSPKTCVSVKINGKECNKLWFDEQKPKPSPEPKPSQRPSPKPSPKPSPEPFDDDFATVVETSSSRRFNPIQKPSPSRGTVRPRPSGSPSSHSTSPDVKRKGDNKPAPSPGSDRSASKKHFPKRSQQHKGKPSKGSSEKQGKGKQSPEHTTKPRGQNGRRNNNRPSKAK